MKGAMMFRALTLAMTLTCLVTGATTGKAHAQATDAAPATPGPTNPASCTVEPRTMAELRLFIDAAAQAHATPTPEPSPLPLSALPDGEAANAETVAAITATVEQSLACYNATDALRYFAFFSDDLLRSLAVDLASFVVEDRTGLRTPVPLYDDDWILVVEVSTARVLPDGRVGAVIYMGDPGEDEDQIEPGEEQDAAFFIFVQEGDRWLIDRFIEIEDSGEDCCAEPTPVAGT